MNRTPLFQALGLRSLRLSFFLLAVLLLLFPTVSAWASDGGAFVSQNVPTSMVAGQQYSVSVTMQNIGTTTWTDGNNYRLGFCHPQGTPQSTAIWSTPGNRVIQPLNVPPQGKVTFAFLVTAPAAAGTYNFQWQMLQENVAWIGTPSANVSIVVTAPPGGQPTNPQIPLGGSTAFSGASSDGGGNRVGSWVVSFPNGGYASSTSNTNPPWSVHCNNGVLTVGVPSGASPVANYSVNYTTSSQTIKNPVDNTTEIVTSGYGGNFDVVTPVAPPPAPAATGAPYSWQASVGGVNTANGNKMVTIPLVGWTGRGGMPVGIALTFNSLAPSNNNPINAPISAPKWTLNYEVFLVQSGSNVTITWGDGRTYTFSRNADGSYTPPRGIYDTLTPNANSSFDLKTKGQTTYHFGNWGAAHYLTSIVDENNNKIILNRQGGARIGTVTDPSGRTITLSYDGSSRLNFVRNDQTGQHWVPRYDGSGNLTQIDWPSINGTTPNMTLGYDGNRNLNAIHDLNGSYSWAAGYDGGSRLTSQVDAYNNPTTFDYTSGTGTKVTDANNQSTTYVYLVATSYQGATLYSVADPLNYTDYYSYDGGNNLTSHKDRRGKVWTYNTDQ